MNPFISLSPTDPYVIYFARLGYTVTWDMNTRQGLKWYEILEDGKLTAQIDMGIPLADAIEDITCWAQGRDATSKSDYTIIAPPGERTDRLFAKVAANPLPQPIL